MTEYAKIEFLDKQLCSRKLQMKYAKLQGERIKSSTSIKFL